MAPLEYTVPLCPFEIRLLKNLENSIVANQTELFGNADQKTC
jgi:hypothetical protein